MKQIFALLGIVATLTFFSCSKNNDHLSRSVTIDTTLASGALYQLNLQQYGDADDVATITKQATDFTTSQIANAATGFAPVYNFSASATKNALSEQVVIAITEGNRNGGNNNHRNCDSTLVTINFKVQ